MTFFRRVMVCSLIGLIAGISSTGLLKGLAVVTQLRGSYPLMILALPIVGLLIGLTYWKYGQSVSGGNALIIDEVHFPRARIPFRMTPLILTSTVLTHLFGGSAGREGTAVQMSASLTDQLSRWVSFTQDERRSFLIAAIGAGFGSAVGAPLAGIVFGMEVLDSNRFKWAAPLESVVASLVADVTAQFLRAPHSHYTAIEAPFFNIRTLGMIVIAGGCFGCAARFFIVITAWVESVHHRWVGFPPLRPLIGGVVILGLYATLGSLRYAGLGLPIIAGAFDTPASVFDPIIKTIATALTIGSGFKGGEFIPLVFIGTTLGSALAPFLSISVPLLAGVGFAAVFGAAANTPVACCIMAIELFGPRIVVYATVGCAVSYWVSGRNSVYRSPHIA